MRIATYRNAAQDTDGGTMTALEEYIAGTDPNDCNSFLKVDSASAGGPPW